MQTFLRIIDNWLSLIILQVFLACLFVVVVVVLKKTISNTLIPLLLSKLLVLS